MVDISAVAALGVAGFAFIQHGYRLLNAQKAG